MLTSELGTIVLAIKELTKAWVVAEGVFLWRISSPNLGMSSAMVRPLKGFLVAVAEEGVGRIEEQICVFGSN